MRRKLEIKVKKQSVHYALEAEVIERLQANAKAQGITATKLISQLIMGLPANPAMTARGEARQHRIVARKIAITPEELHNLAVNFMAGTPDITKLKGLLKSKEGQDALTKEVIREIDNTHSLAKYLREEAEKLALIAKMYSNTKGSRED